MRAVFLILLAGGIAFVARDHWTEAIRAARNYSGYRRVEGHREVIAAAARESIVDPYLLAGLMMAESSGRVSVRSNKGALGLFQLMPTTAGERARVLGLPEPTEEELLSDPLLNARLGADYLSWLLDRNGGDVERALVAYNAGPARLDRWIDEAGGWEAWRDERRAAGNSDVLAYVDKVRRYTDRFRSKALFEPDEKDERDDRDR